MKAQLLNQLVNFILGVVGIVSTFALAKLSQYLEAKKNEVATKKGIDNYNRALQIAKGLYLVLEEEFKDIAKAGADKKTEMDKRLLELVPELTQQELDSINKQIWTEFNAKVVDVITSPVKE